MPSSDPRQDRQIALHLESVKLNAPQNSGGSSSRTAFIAVAAALLTAAVVAPSVAMAMKKPACTAHSLNAPFDISAGVKATPSAVTPLPAASTPHMHRADASFNNTNRAGKTISAGITTITGADGAEEYTMRLEVVNDAPFGEYATSTNVGRRSLRVVITSPDGAITSMIPFGLHTVPISNTSVKTLRPNLFFMQHIPPVGRSASGAFKTFISTVSGQTVASDTSLQSSVEATLEPFLQSYWKAVTADAPPASSSRLLSEGSDTYEGSELGSEAGSYVGGKVGSTVGGDVGEAVGGAVGGAIGSLVGPEGTAIGADIGSAVGNEVGSYVGKQVGEDVGSDVGSDLGGDVGSEVSSWGSSSSSGGYSYGGR